MKKLKLSWSILDKWASGYKSDAIKALSGIPIDITDPNMKMAVEFGIEIHRTIAEKKLDLLGILPKDAIFEDFRPEDGCFRNWFRAELESWITFSLVADVLYPLKNGTWGVLDWKTGRKNSTEQKAMQIYIYAYVLGKLDKPITVSQGIIAHVDRDPQGLIYCTDYSMSKITEDKLMLAENYIITLASEMMEALSNYNKSKYA